MIGVKASTRDACKQSTRNTMMGKHSTGKGDDGREGLHQRRLQTQHKKHNVGQAQHRKKAMMGVKASARDACKQSTRNTMMGKHSTGKGDDGREGLHQRRLQTQHKKHNDGQTQHRKMAMMGVEASTKDACGHSTRNIEVCYLARSN